MSKLFLAALAAIIVVVAACSTTTEKAVVASSPAAELRLAMGEEAFEALDNLMEVVQGFKEDGGRKSAGIAQRICPKHCSGQEVVAYLSSANEDEKRQALKSLLGYIKTSHEFSEKMNLEGGKVRHQGEFYGLGREFARNLPTYREVLGV